jgi:hypothetical protein
MSFYLGDDEMWIFKVLDWTSNDLHIFFERFMSSNWATIISFSVFLLVLGIVGAIIAYIKNLIF